MRLWSRRLALAAVLALAAQAMAGAQIISGGKLRITGLNASGGGPDTLLSTDPDHPMTAYVSIGQNTAAAMSGGAFSIVSGLLDIPSAQLDLSRLHAFPNPFRPSQGHDRVTFRGTTTNTTIRVYTLSGWLVRTLIKNNPSSQDLIWWPVANDAGQPLASGVYPYIADGDNNNHKSGKLMVIK